MLVADDTSKIAVNAFKSIFILKRECLYAYRFLNALNDIFKNDFIISVIKIDRIVIIAENLLLSVENYLNSTHFRFYFAVFLQSKTVRLVNLSQITIPAQILSANLN